MASNIEGFKAIIFTRISLLLVCVPFGIVSSYSNWDQSLTFWLNFFAMIPLAKILGDATEELANSLHNDMLSGLLNATFGNAVEMIMAITFLQKHEYTIVKASMLGSVLSNMLLVLGMSFFFGGLVNSKRSDIRESLIQPREKQQRFSQVAAIVNTTMLLLCCLMLCIVTVFDQMDGADSSYGPNKSAEDARILPISRICSIMLVLAYVMYIIFQLFTHKNTIAKADEDEEGGEEEEEELPQIDAAAAIGLLLACTVVVAWCSECLTGALEGALEGSGMGREFLGIILLPIVGNACEHVAAVSFAMKDKAGISVGIAIGSSVQIALLVTPFSVLIGYLMGDDAVTGKNMDLNFGALNVAVLTMSVIVVLAIVVDGKSNWLEGYLLCTAYFMIAILYWYVPDDVRPASWVR